MITTGQSLRNPVTGETLVFRTTSADSNGERVVVEAYVEPNGAVAAAHVHPAQEELFEVLAGELQFRLGKQIVAKPGYGALVPAGTPHRFENAGEETAHFVCEVTPALGFEQLIETMFSLAARRQGQQEGDAQPAAARGYRPPPFRRRAAAVPPAWLQRLGLAFGAPLGRMLGFKPTYEPKAPKAPTARSSAPPRPPLARAPARPARPPERRATDPQPRLTHDTTPRRPLT